MGKLIDLTGRIFGELKVVSRQGTSRYGQAQWLCQCSCGNQITVLGDNLRRGHTRSCGCLKFIVCRTHGKARTSIFGCWDAMIQRCINVSNKHYHNYGGRGITVCDRWLKFENFYADMGDRPKGMSLERIDNNKGYSPENCKWATQKEQMRNTRQNRILKYRGREQCLTAWAEELGINPSTLNDRLTRHDVHEAFNM